MTDVTTPDILIGFDTETHRIGPQRVAPPLVCVTAWDGEAGEIVGVADPDNAVNKLIDQLLQPSVHLVAHNAAFDLAVLANHRPDLFSTIFDALEHGRVYDTKIREKLLVLATTGSLDYAELPGGEKHKLSYSLADLVMKYLGEDRSADKAKVGADGKVEGDTDAWRLNYAALEAMPTSEWPQAARDYAVQDASDAYLVWWAQEQRRRHLIETAGIDAFATQDFQTAVDFCLMLMTCWGMAVDAEQVARVEELIATELAPEKLSLLVEAGILRPGEEPRPYANGATNQDGSPKMTRGKKESINTTKLKSHIEKLAKERPDDFAIKYTKPSERFPEGQLSTDAEWLKDHAHLDPVLEQYQHRQKLQKLVTTELPRMKWEGETSPVVHPCFDVLKETTRTSSFASNLYPSFNIQNVDPRARECYVARDGYVLFSIDYSALELCTAAQKCLQLFGRSVLADQINAGVDPHEYLGAQIAYATHPEFQESCRSEQAHSQQDIYKAFHECKNHENEDVAKFWAHYRKMAKPTGLGYPGGLGPKTFVQYAKATFGVIVDLPVAEQLRELWYATFPEMQEYHRWVNEQVDTRNGPRDREINGVVRSVDAYAYTSPFGTYRAGCDYCACANGAALQTPAADGAKLAVFNVVRACYDPMLGSVLYPDQHGPTTRPIGIIHDELLGEVRDDPMAHDRVMDISRIMVEAMKVVTPDIDVKCSVALMRRWSKEAKAVFDEQGRLIPWEPDVNPQEHDHGQESQENEEVAKQAA